MFTLTRKVVFYIPSTSGNETISGNRFANRTNQIAKILAGYFGGCTVTTGNGLYVDNSGRLISEAVNLVASFATSEAIDDHYNDVITEAGNRCRQWKQETIGIEIDDHFVLVDTEAATIPDAYKIALTEAGISEEKIKAFYATGYTVEAALYEHNTGEK